MTRPTQSLSQLRLEERAVTAIVLDHEQPHEKAGGRHRQSNSASHQRPKCERDPGTGPKQRQRRRGQSELKDRAECARTLVRLQTIAPRRSVGGLIGQNRGPPRCPARPSLQPGFRNSAAGGARAADLRNLHVAPKQHTPGVSVAGAEGKLLAEREGFEPSIRLRVFQFSRLTPSATRPPLRSALFDERRAKLQASRRCKVAGRTDQGARRADPNHRSKRNFSTGWT